MTPLVASPEQTLVAVLRQMVSGKRSAEAVISDSLARIEQVEPRLKAWVHLDRELALAAAREWDSRFQKGEPPAGLQGIPLGIKDLFDVAGSPTGCGFAPWECSSPCPQDGPLVAHLRRAGGILLGKTVTTQFACFDPPETVNPWNPSRTPGGSSSGSAAAVASGMCLAALGSQTGGSIIRPASFCGIAGYKPSWGRFPVMGVFPAAPSLDVPGPMARCVHDLWLLEGVLSGADNRDTLSRLEDEGRPLTRLGILRGRFERVAAPDCWMVFEQTVERMSQSGVAVSDCPLPVLFETVVENHRTVMITEISANHECRLQQSPGDYLPRMAGLVREGCAVRGVDYVRAKEHQRALSADMERMLADGRVVACPATPGGAPGIDTTGDPTFNSPFSYCGLPAVTLPMGLDSGGLPLGLQLVAGRGKDRDLLQAALWCERLLGRVLPG